VIHPTAFIGPSVTIGTNVTIGPYSVIGNRGFAVYKENGTLKMPEADLGVVIEDDVYIGSHTTIDSGLLKRPTFIGQGAKIDSHCMIGHDAHVGRHTSLSGMVGLASGAYVDDHCTIFGQVGIANWKYVGQGKVVMAQSLVTKNLDSKERLFFGSPALPLKQWNVWWRALQATLRKRKLKRKTEYLFSRENR
jgi:UDP-3-O-[3-hydroxymyristoyl] glucosamine N-acyltransferase